MTFCMAFMCIALESAARKYLNKPNICSNIYNNFA